MITIKSDEYNEEVAKQLEASLEYNIELIGTNDLNEVCRLIHTELYHNFDSYVRHMSRDATDDNKPVYTDWTTWQVIRYYQDTSVKLKDLRKLTSVPWKGIF